MTAGAHYCLLDITYAAVHVRCCIAFSTGAIQMQVTLRRFYRPEDISRDVAYNAEFTDLYESQETLAVALDDVVSKCSVLPPGQPITGASACLLYCASCT